MNKIVMIIALALVFSMNANAKPYMPNYDLSCWKDTAVCPAGASW